jgi:autophagy-related protein 2
MIFLKILCSRSDDMQRIIECDVKLSIQPLRFNIDQDALLFIVDYFKCLLSKQITFSNINNTNNNHSTTNDTQSNFEANTSTDEQDSEQKIEQKIFIRNFIFSPDLLIRFDFSGKYDNRTDNKLDTLTNILLILVQLSNTEIKLKHVCYKRGFLGIEKLLNCLLNDWVADIKNNQVKNLIKGWGLFNSLIQLFEGFSCLFWYPIEQYRKDGRVLFGIKKGSAAFSTCTVLATIELTNRLFQLTKNIAEFVYDLVTPHQTLSVTNGLVKNRNIRNRRQPNDIRQGLENAYLVLYEGFNDTAANIANDIITGKEHSGLRGAVGGALRQIPSAAIVPFVKAAEASSNILSGIRNQLKPDEKRDDEQKYKSVGLFINLI